MYLLTNGSFKKMLTLAIFSFAYMCTRTSVQQPVSMCVYPLLDIQDAANITCQGLLRWTAQVHIMPTRHHADCQMISLFLATDHRRKWFQMKRVPNQRHQWRRQVGSVSVIFLCYEAKGYIQLQVCNTDLLKWNDVKSHCGNQPVKVRGKVDWRNVISNFFHYSCIHISMAGGVALASQGRGSNLVGANKCPCASSLKYMPWTIRVGGNKKVFADRLRLIVGSCWYI